MKTRWLDIMRRAGDEHVGQTLTRLASLAVAAHQQAAIDHDSIRKEPFRSEGLDRMAVVTNPSATQFCGPELAHTEVRQ